MARMFDQVPDGERPAVIAALVAPVQAARED
jgi:hypothetical protein